MTIVPLKWVGIQKANQKNPSGCRIYDLTSRTAQGE